MKDPLKAATGLSLGGLFVLFAMHGEAFWRGAMGAWTFLVAITTTAPLGVASFFASWGLATLLCIALKRWARANPVNNHARGFWIETITGIFAMVLAWLQMRSTAGMIVGAFAGFMAPYAAKAIMAVATWVRQVLAAKDPAP